MFRNRKRTNSLKERKHTEKDNISPVPSNESKPEVRRRNSLKKVASNEFSDNKSWKDSRRLVFVFGTVLGLVLALWVGSSSDGYKKDLFDNFYVFESVQNYVGDWKELLPSSVSGLIADFQFDNTQADLTESFAVGKQLRKEMNLTDKHPIIIVPGVISTGIESWGLYKDDECDSEPHFRKRLWGSFYMLKNMVMDKACWLKHVKLDPETGLDLSLIHI